MRLARVVGNAVATHKTASHMDFKMMVVRVLSPDGKLGDESNLAIDCSQAGIGDYVLICEEGGGCHMLMKRKLAAVNCTIIGIVDYLDIGDRRIDPWKEGSGQEGWQEKP